MGGENRRICLESIRKALETLQKGDTACFEQIRAQYEQLLTSMVNKCLQVYHYDAEYDDLMQEASLALYKAAMSYDLTQTEVTFGLYAKICVRNRMISAGRKLNRQKKSQSAEAIRHYSSSVRTQKRYAEFAQFGDLSQVIDTVFSDFEKLVFTLYLQGHSYKEMAIELKRNEKSIDNAICRMKRKLKKYLLQDSN